MKIILAYLSGASNRDEPYISLVPTGLSQLHASLREAGYDSVLVNFSGWPVSQIERELLVIKPDMIGISQWTHNRHSSLDLAFSCRRLFPESFIIMGGGHATFCYDELLSEGSPVNCVVIGEGDLTLLELAERVLNRAGWFDICGLAFRRAGKVFVTSRRAPLADLDQLPMPARYLEHSIGLDMELQPEFIVTSRGCPSSCHFCSSPAFWGKKVRFRSAHSIVDEIMFVRDQFGLIYFSIRDDTFTADRRRAMEFCSTLIESRANILWNCQSRVTAIDEELLIMMKRSGCECIQLGVESGSPRILRQLNKNILPAQVERACAIIRKVGITLSIYLISGIPDETADDLCQTIDLLRRIHPDDGYVSPLAYYPGTRLFTDAVASGITDRNVFAGTHQNALYATTSPDHSFGRLLKELSNNRDNDSFRFKRQKELLGYCYTTNILAGEFYRQAGDSKSALREFKEITAREPDNSWGWFLLGELYSDMRNGSKAGECYSKVLGIIPRHGPSRAAVSK
ncbi:MAG: radical SAM protein [Desulfuromonadaceae bacterium]|nr:radical SAM protein [Desulfuromonadaceae bacterium]